MCLIYAVHYSFVLLAIKEIINVHTLTECTFFYHGITAIVGQGHLTVEDSCPNSVRQTTLGWTPLDE